MTSFQQKIALYLRYARCCLIYVLTGKRMPPELRGNVRQWVFYSVLKPRYAAFIRKQPLLRNETHEYSDIVWWCWLQGEDNAPPVVQACLASLRKHLSGKKIIVLTEENLWDYAQFPEYIVTKYQKGIIFKKIGMDTYLYNLIQRRTSESDPLIGVVAGDTSGGYFSLPSDFFNEVIEHEFEGHLLMIPVRYDEYLKKYYGDYMKIPPESERVPHHSYSIYRNDAMTSVILGGVTRLPQRCISHCLPEAA